MRSWTTRSMRSRPIAELVLDQLADGADAAVAEVVDVVLGCSPRLHSMSWPTMAAMSSRVIVRLSRSSSMPIRCGGAVELLVELVAADPAEVVAAEVEEQALDQRARVVTRRRVARAQLLVDLEQRLVRRPGDVLVERGRDERVLGVDVDRREQRRDLVVRLVADARAAGWSPGSCACGRP